MDRISHLANTHTKGRDTNHLTKDELLRAKAMHVQESDQIMQTIDTYPTGEQLADVHWRTLICNMSNDLSRTPPDFAQSYSVWRTRIAILNPSVNAPEVALSQDFRVSFDKYNSDKFFGRTENGYVGMFPWRAQVGDEIYILFGGDFPFVLRRLDQNQCFQLVGQCYIHGVMNGELDWRSQPQEAIYLGGPFEIAEEVDKA